MKPTKKNTANEATRARLATWTYVLGGLTLGLEAITTVVYESPSEPAGLVSLGDEIERDLQRVTRSLTSLRERLSARYVSEQLAAGETGKG